MSDTPNRPDVHAANEVAYVRKSADLDAVNPWQVRCNSHAQRFTVLSSHETEREAELAALAEHEPDRDDVTAAVCPSCEGKLEASSKVYFDVEVHGDTLTALEYSGLNDAYQGHPVALEAELTIQCSECGRDFGYQVAEELAAQFDFNGLGV